METVVAIVPWRLRARSFLWGRDIVKKIAGINNRRE
jgi:hypothetical protein